jgi:hypothetical protein
MIFTYKPYKRYLWAFCLVFGAVYATCFQVLGGVMNINTASEIQSNPQGTIVPLAQEQAVKTMVDYSLILYIIPYFLSIVVFWIFERIYLPKI